VICRLGFDISPLYFAIAGVPNENMFLEPNSSIETLELLLAHPQMDPNLGYTEWSSHTLDGEEGKKSKKDKKAGKFAQTQSMAASMDPKAAKRKDGYIAVGNVNTDFQEKNIKLLELANGQFLAVRWEDTGDVYVIPCASTAFSYPLIDGESILIFTRAISLTDVVFWFFQQENSSSDLWDPPSASPWTAPSTT